MMKRAERLSLIIPNFNKGKYLRQAVKSALNQKIPRLEILVIDDGSTDGSYRQVWDLPVRLIRLSKNQGQAHAQNVGLEESRGTILSFLDSDDVLAPQGLFWRWELLSQGKEPWVAGPVAGTIGVTGSQLSDSALLLVGPKTKCKMTWESYRQAPCIPSQSWTWAARRELLNQVGFFEESLLCAHDHDYLCRLFQKTMLSWHPIPTVYYRLYDQNLSGSWANGKFRVHPKFLAETLWVNHQHGVHYAPLP